MSARVNKRPRSSEDPNENIVPAAGAAAAAAAAAADSEDERPAPLEEVDVPVPTRELFIGVITGEEETVEILEGFGFTPAGAKKVIQCSRALLAIVEELRTQMLLYTDKSLTSLAALQEQQLRKGLEYFNAVEALAAAETLILPHTDDVVYVFAPRNMQCFCRRKVSIAWFFTICAKGRWSPFVDLNGQSIHGRLDYGEIPPSFQPLFDKVWGAIRGAPDIVLHDQMNNTMKFPDLEAEQYMARPFVPRDIGQQC